MSLDTEDEQHFGRVLSENGHKRDDFDARATEDDVPAKYSGAVYAVNETITITRKSNGCTRAYRQLSGREWWMVKFERELRGGVFGPPSAD